MGPRTHLLIAVLLVAFDNNQILSLQGSRRQLFQTMLIADTKRSSWPQI